MNIDWYWFVLGVIIGWITKIPIFIHLYRNWERETLEQYQIYKRVLELMDRDK